MYQTQIYKSVSQSEACPYHVHGFFSKPMHIYNDITLLKLTLFFFKDLLKSVRVTKLVKQLPLAQVMIPASPCSAG